MKTVYIKTYGCQMNEYDSKRMLDLLAESHNMTEVATPEDADLILLNTCSIREKAQEKVFSDLGRWRKLKEKKPGTMIGVGGCVASQEGKQIQTRAPFVDLVFGPQTLHRLPVLLTQAKAANSQQCDISFPEIEKFDHLPKPRAEGPTAYVSIQEGCNKYCTYCIVPYTRGSEIDRPFKDVLQETHQLALQGVREVTFLGQNVNAYKGLQPDGTPADLALLIQYAANITGIERIRFTTSHPMEFNDRLIAAYQQVDALASHLHLPVQSGSDHILSLMKRGHTTLEYKDKIRRLRIARPNITISSDFIVGFPGERDTDFEETCQLVTDIGFDQSFSFIYSKRPGTPAASLKDDVSLETKKARLQKLQALLKVSASEISTQMVEHTVPVLVTGRAKKNADELSGRTENNRVVNFQGPEHYIGQIIPILITEALPNSLRGRVVDS